MSIVATEVESIHGAPGKQRLVFYRCTDHLGGIHNYGPLVADPGFDAEAHKTVVAARVQNSLAEEEAAELLG